MGYLTYHTMSIENATEDDRKKIVKFLDDLGVIGYALNENLDGAYPVTWYDEPEQMEQVSLAFPHVHFTVHGEGDNNGDIWDHHCLNGMFQEIRAQIVIPPLDPNGWTESEYVQEYKARNQNLPDFEPEDISSLMRQAV